MAGALAQAGGHGRNQTPRRTSPWAAPRLPPAPRLCGPGHGDLCQCVWLSAPARVPSHLFAAREPPGRGWGGGPREETSVHTKRRQRRTSFSLLATPLAYFFPLIEMQCATPTRRPGRFQRLRGTTASTLGQGLPKQAGHDASGRGHGYETEGATPTNRSNAQRPSFAGPQTQRLIIRWAEEVQAQVPPLSPRITSSKYFTSLNGPLVFFST